MQLFEQVFFLIFLAAITRLVFGQLHPRFTYLNIAIAGIVSMIAGLVLEGFRWQMLPAYVGFFCLILATLKKSESRKPVRIVGAISLGCLLLLAVFLTHQLPIVQLPVPAGPFGVGTFEYSITDENRVERYAPERNRELYLEIWYPAEKDLVADTEVRTLFQELYEGEWNPLTYLISYLRHIPTHSHVQAPITAPATGGFPVLLFSHGGSSITSQNQQLMEHLASNGYVILSIGHPYDSLKVNLKNAGTIRMANTPPSDITLPIDEMERGILTKVVRESGLDYNESSRIRALLLALADDYANTANEADRNGLLATALENELQPYTHLMTDKTLGEYLTYVYVYQHSLVDYRVKDMQFIADNIATIEAPISGFQDALDLSGFGIFGMSLGGAVAGEFCKIDSRCSAGTNLDGTQFGGHWDQKVAAPFLMFYHEAHQGGNDFAYLPPINDFWDYGVRGTEHIDFVEVAYTVPLLKLIGMTGAIDKSRMIEIINKVQLNFFDHYLKDKPIPGELYENIPEIIVRNH